MKDIFTDLYNKIVEFFNQEEEKDKTKDVARNRLKLVLMQDRTNLNPRLLERMRGELIELLSKYVEMDKELLELNFEPENDQFALMLSIPVIRAKDEKEIEEALKAEDEAKAKLEAVNESDEEDEDESDDAEDLEEDEVEDDSESEKEEGEEVSKEDESEETEKPKKKKKKHKKKKAKVESETETETQEEQAETTEETVEEKVEDVEDNSNEDEKVEE